MFIDPVLKLFWILAAGILGTNAAWLLYVSHVEDELSVMYKILQCKPLSQSEKKKLNKLSRRKSK